MLLLQLDKGDDETDGVPYYRAANGLSALYNSNLYIFSAQTAGFEEFNACIQPVARIHGPQLIHNHVCIIFSSFHHIRIRRCFST